MKLSPLLLAASVASAFVIPDEDSAHLTQTHQRVVGSSSFDNSKYTQSIVNSVLQNFIQQAPGDQHPDDININDLDFSQDESSDYPSEEDFLADLSDLPDYSQDELDLEADLNIWEEPVDGPDEESNYPWKDELHIPPNLPPPAFNEPHRPEHDGKPEKTIYQLISTSEHTKIFAHVISKFDDVVSYLNSTQANHTVFVPVDRAFKIFKGHEPKIPKEYILKWLHYHIAPGVFTTPSFFAARTVPTLLKQGDGVHPQRINTRFGFRGFTLNYYSHIIKSNIFATNGVIHGINKILLPPFPVVDTIDLLPSVLSTFDLGLVKTKLDDVLKQKTLALGGTVFAPTNFAFRKLGPKINAFLFSRFGTKYLNALLKYHIIANHTLYSDAYYQPKADAHPPWHSHFHVDLPTLLLDTHLSVELSKFPLWVSIWINDDVRVIIPDIPVKEGVIHLVHSVLIPPLKHKKPRSTLTEELWENEDPDEVQDNPDLMLKEFIDRLEPYV